ncbi:MAG: GFA family protein [Alphaproteobacteria bacterium]|nr:GFA family protein [Alphaproteobacteria bacterium]
MERTAMCSCGSLRLKIKGEPARVVICHCFQCQRRSGSVFSDNAYFPRAALLTVEGEVRDFSRPTERGGRVTFHFCPKCGSSVYWDLSLESQLIGVAVGAFADPGFTKPSRSVFGVTRHHWMPEIEGTEAFLADHWGPKE